MKTSSAVVLVAALAAILIASPLTSLQAQGQGQGPGPGPSPGQGLGQGQGQGQGLAVGRPEWVPAARHDTSRPLREMPPQSAASTRESFVVKEAPLTLAETQVGQAGQVDQSVQSLATTPLAAVNGVGFDGVGEFNSRFSYNVNSAPPDTTGEAGLTQYVQWVNTSFAVFDKTDGHVLLGPIGGRTLWSGFGGDCETRNDGDPIVQYDHLADRWVMTQFSLRSGNYLQCVAVSQTEDATGSWHRYAFSYAEFPDYPKLSVWPDAYYITFNMFGATGTNFTGGRVCAYDRAQMLIGQPAIQVCFQNGFGSPLASDLDGQTLPPTGTPNYVMNRGNSSTLNLWKFTPNFAVPANSTYTGPTSISVLPFSSAGGGVPQPGTTQRLDQLGTRLMYRLSYRNLGTREVLLVNHSVAANSVTGVRWYELNITGGVPSVRQQSTFAPNDGHHRWMGSVAMDHVGNIALGYSIGSATMPASVSYAGREAGDSLNTLGLDNIIQAGTGSQTGGLSRWGDYSNMAVDPVDDCTFWFTSEFLKVNGSFNWSTRVGSFRFASCTTDTEPPTPNFTLAATPSTRTITQGQSTTFAATVTGVNSYVGEGSFSVTGLPANATGVFTQASYSGGAGSTTLNITTATDTPPGPFLVTIKATDDADASLMQSAVVTLTVNPASVADFAISASPLSRNIKRGKSGSFAVTATPSGGFTGNVGFGVTGCPSNSSCTFSTRRGKTSLKVSVGRSTPVGPYVVVITGTSGSLVRSTSVTVNVQ